MNENTLLITELLSGKLLHDLANSMNGIIFGMEELSIENDSSIDALSLLRESSDDLLCKQRVMKQAYSISGDNLDFNRTKCNIEEYLLKKKIKVAWNISSDIDEKLVAKINKIICNMLLTIAGAVAGVEQISIILNKTEGNALLTIKAFNEHKSLSSSVIDKLVKKEKFNLDMHNISVYLTSLLLESYNAEIHHIYEDNFFKIDIKL